jgi:Mrp family chromosome partitioning ATPase
VKQAMARLARVGARVLGAVLNDVDVAAMRDYYGEPYPTAAVRADAGDAA